MIVPADLYEPITGEHLAALERAYPSVQPVTVAFRLARNLATCAALLRGESVDRDQLDPAALAWALERRHVSLHPLIDPASVAA